MKVIRLLILVMSVTLFPAVMQGAGDGAQRVERVEMSHGPNAQGGVGHIRFHSADGDAVFRVFSITGQLVRVVKVPADQVVTIEMPKGFYIVKCGDQWSRKVVVK